ncbi:hypothetical protein PIB30_086131 [Stylosanthes scabra]|uniref:Uncharacterized protein n=1 Tax=Stylosanthes scabra TaxID=79078 RepID=A0ABU6XQI6_9FABA|nr:hypothetical protein [Stylosanthes scabra]
MLYACGAIVQGEAWDSVYLPRSRICEIRPIRRPSKRSSSLIRQLKDWTRNASGRESYMVWAHQLANPNLVEMSSQKIVKQIYDNIDRKMPMFRGLLKSDLQPSDPTQPPSSSKDPKDPPSSSKDPKDPPK